MIKGYFDKFVVVDCETSGISFGGNPSENHQAVSFGILISDVNNFEVIDGLYVEIKWNGVAKWEYQAEQLHGMSKKYLEENGVTEKEAAEQIGGLFAEHFDLDHPISLMGHNVGTFDLPFLRKLLNAHDLPFKFAHRHMDTFSLSMGTVQAYNSDDLFELMGVEKRKEHNALDDAAAALKVYRTIHNIWKKAIG